MARTKSKLTLATACFAMLLGTTMLSAPARADYQKVGENLNSDGSVSSYYVDDDSDYVMVIRSSVDKDGHLTLEIWQGTNPNPEDTATGKGSHSDKPDVIGMLKSGQATYHVKIAPADSAELMSHIKGVLGDGGGLGPHYNPGDQDDNKGPGAAPTHTMQVKKTAAEIRAQIAALNESAKALQILGTSMGTGDEGGSESANGPGKGNGKGGKVDDSGNYTEGQNKNVGKTEKDLLGAHPEVINPPHLNKVGKAGGAGLSVTGAGLLDGGGAGFNQNGPSSTGSPGTFGGGSVNGVGTLRR